jgi:cell wall assembly regulator SMI1
MGVAEQWDRITRWCDERAPVTIRSLRPGLKTEEVLAAEHLSGLAWPQDLRELFAVQNGAQYVDEVTGRYPGSILPMQVLLSVDDALERRTQLLEVWTELIQSDPDMFGADSFDVGERQPAGSTAWMFLPSFMPFSGLDGYVYFVDTRPGPQHGCVTEYAHSDTDSRGPKWDSVTTMLAAHADALESGVTVGNFRPAAVDGALSWEIVSAR